MNFALYRELLAVQPIRRLLFVGMVARIPHSAAGVLLTLHIVLTLDKGYAAAGAAAAVMTIGIAVGAPWRGRRVDTVGLRRALIPSVVSEAVIWSVVPHVSYEWLLPLVFVGGLLTLPIFSVIRQSLGVLADGDQRRTAFALDSIATEMVFMIGPAAGAVVATSGFTVLGLTVVGVSTSLAGLFLIWFNPPTRSAAQTGEGEADQRHAAEVAVVSAAPAHLQEAAADLVPPVPPGPERAAAGMRGRVAHNFAWFTATVAAVFAVAAGTGMVLERHRRRHCCRTGDRRAPRRNRHRVPLLVRRVGDRRTGLRRHARPVSPILLLLGMAALTIPMGFAYGHLDAGACSPSCRACCAHRCCPLPRKSGRPGGRRAPGRGHGLVRLGADRGRCAGSPSPGVFIDGTGPSGGFVSVGVAGVVLCLAGLLLQAARRRRVAA